MKHMYIINHNYICKVILYVKYSTCVPCVMYRNSGEFRFQNILILIDTLGSKFKIILFIQASTHGT